METDHRVLVVLPALNEAETVAQVVRAVHDIDPAFDVLVVDDGSWDGTADLARSAGATSVTLPFNVGVGGAMRLGFRYALRHGYSAVVQVDADGQHDPEHLRSLLAGLQSADVVVGSRFAQDSGYRVGRMRRGAMRVLASLVSRYCGERLTDVTSGYRASGPRAIRLFAFHYPVEYLADTVESLVLAARSGLIVTERPVVMHERAGGQASQSPVRASVHLLRSVSVLALAVVHAPVSPSLDEVVDA